MRTKVSEQGVVIPKELLEGITEVDIRKQNGIIGFGTQSAADIVRSSSASTLIEQTATNVFFPNPKADDEFATTSARPSSPFSAPRAVVSSSTRWRRSASTS